MGLLSEDLLHNPATCGSHGRLRLGYDVISDSELHG
jgi:hypothetical protein